MFDYQDAIAEYAQSLEDFIIRNELPPTWFKKADHIAIKCADADDYEYRLQDLLADARQASQVYLDGRHLAALLLTSAQPVGSMGDVSWAEIMEPRPDKTSETLIGVDHMEFYYPNFGEIAEILQKRGVPFQQRSNPGHDWINIKLNSQGQEVKLNNRPLAEIVEDELTEGIAHLL